MTTHTLLGFTAEDWRTVLQGVGSCMTAVIGAAGLAYARVAMKRATAARDAAVDATEGAGRAETAAAGGTSDLSADVQELKRIVLQRTGPVRVRPRAAAPVDLDGAAAAITERSMPAVSETPAGAPETPQDEAPEGAGPDGGVQAPVGAPAAPDEGGEPSLDTQAVWTLLRGGRP